jgi:hypothetical protein
MRMKNQPIKGQWVVDYPIKEVSLQATSAGWGFIASHLCGVGVGHYKTTPPPLDGLFLSLPFLFFFYN